MKEQERVFSAGVPPVIALKPLYILVKKNKEIENKKNA